MARRTRTPRRSPRIRRCRIRAVSPRTCTMLPPGTRKVGILAGWGRYPVVIAEALREQGYEVFVLGSEGTRRSRTGQIERHFGWVGLAKIGARSAFFAATACVM